MHTRTNDIGCRSLVQLELDECTAISPELASYWHLVRADLPAAKQRQGMQLHHCRMAYAASSSLSMVCSADAVHAP